MSNKPGSIDEAGCRTRADTQERLRRRSGSLLFARSASAKLMNLNRIRDGDRTVEHADIQRCVTSGIVTDFGLCEGGVMVTIRGSDREGEGLIVYLFVPDANECPVRVEDFLLG